MPKINKKPKKQSEPEIMYPVVEARMFHADARAMTEWCKEKSDGNPLTGDVAKELLGFYTEPELQSAIFERLPPDQRKEIKEPSQIDVGIHPILQINGEPIYCKNNLANRPYRPGAADDYKMEVLRRKWKFNGETIIVDKYGMLHDGQHRLLGLLLAIEEWKEDGKKPKSSQKWQKIWAEEPYIESMVILGIENDDETTNTIGCGIRRSLEDVLFRSPYFEDKPFVERKKLSKITSWAAKLLWDRTSQQTSSLAPRRPHSESVDFIHRHERLLECVRFIYEEANDKFMHLVPLGHAAGLMYLMAACTSDFDKYSLVNSESEVDFKYWDRAEEFWVDVASNGKATEPLRDALLDIPEGAGGSFSHGLRCGLIIKAWLLFVDKDKITKAKIEVETSVNGIGQEVLAEHPRIGGLDVESLPPEKPVKEKKETKKQVEHKKAVAGNCPAGGNHDFVEEDGEMICAKCYEPKELK